MTSRSKQEPAKDPAFRLKSAEHAALAKTWDSLISAGIKHRKKFQKAYEVSSLFAYGDHSFIYDDLMEDVPFKATVPKVWEMLNIFGPMLNFRNPHRNVKVRFTPDQQSVAFTQVLKSLLNYSSNETGLVRQMRECVDESLIGCGVMWLEKDDRSGLWGHYHDSPLNLVIDPDAETVEDAWWVARKKQMPRWEFADRIAHVPIDHDDLPTIGRASVTDMVQTSALKSDNDDGDENPSGTTNQLITVWEVFSKMGIGWRAKEMQEEYKSRDEPIGDFVHFYIIPTSRRVWVPSKWPVPLWADNSWPCELLYYRKKRDYVWPVPLLEPSLGLQKAIDWIMTFMWLHLKRSSRDFIVGPQGLEEATKEKILTGVDMTYVDINEALLADKGGDASKIIQFLQHPAMQADLWRYMELALKMFEDSTGLYPALYAQSGGAESRTATADQNKQARADLRPDDMREVVEQFHGRLARKEAIAARLDYDEQFIAQMMGPEAAQVWGMYQQGDLDRVMREYDYRIEAGSASKPNIQTERDTSMEIFDRGAQVAMQMQDLNALNGMFRNLQRGLNIPEEDQVQFQPPPPQPDPEEKKLEIEAKKAEQQMSIEERKAMLKMQIDQQKAELDAKLKIEEAQIDLEAQRMKIEGDMQLQGLQMEAEAIGHEQKIRQTEEMHAAKVAQAKKAKPKAT